jgi:hypothetical protein
MTMVKDRHGSEMSPGVHELPEEASETNARVTEEQNMLPPATTQMLMLLSEKAEVWFSLNKILFRNNDFFSHAP